jgi:probable HAF family extracellular repeat protein
LRFNKPATEGSHLMERSFASRAHATNFFLFLALSAKMMAQEPEVSTANRSAEVRYNIIDLGPVGPPPSGPFMISQNGLSGGSASAQDGTEHATLWLGKARLDLGSPGLGGLNSLGFGVNEAAWVVGGAQTTEANGEDFCGFNAFGFPPSNNACLPFYWHYGVMQPLLTLGGPNGYANMINDRGDIVGVAETSMQDAGCSVHRFNPVAWKNGQPNALTTPDLYGVAAYVNERGQVVGASGSCAPFNPNTLLYLNEERAMFWEANGRPHELPSLGGSGGIAGNHACNVNNLGEAIGHSELTNNTSFHATFWPTLNKVIDLGTLNSDDAGSLALGINDKGVIVGASLDAAFNPRPFIWQHNKLTDLNTLVIDSSGLYLLLAESINNRGEIVGFAATNEGEVHGFQAVPTYTDSDFAGPIPLPRPTPSDPARERLRRELARLHVGIPHK